MTIPIYIVDAFTDENFRGNPAAICPLEKDWLDDNVMQKIAMENNLSETAFFIKNKNGFHLRWFTPTTEVDLCGHATLAASHVLFNHLGYLKNEIIFDSRSGPLHILRHGAAIAMNFPTDTLTPVKNSEELQSCFSEIPMEIYRGRSDFLFVFSSESQIKNMKINLEKIAKVMARGIIITAPGNNSDFVSRFFAPKEGINEDPVTGSAHTTLTPYWYKRLQKLELNAKQLSARGGNLICKYLNDRVEIIGKAKTYLVGEIFCDL